MSEAKKMSRTEVAYRINLSEADGCDTDGCDSEAAFVDVYILEDGSLLHAFSCVDHKPLSKGIVVDGEEPIPN